MSKALNKVAQQLSELNRRVGGLERSRSLSRSSIVDGAIRTVELVPTEEYDEFGNPIYEERVIGSIGKQPDGGWATVVNEGPIPSTPVPPDVVGGLGWLSIRWTGGFVDGLPPTSDHHSVEVHVAPEHEQDKIGTEETLHGAFGLAGGTHTVTSLDAGHYIVGLVSVSTAGKRSPISLYTEGDISEGPTAVEVADLKARIDEASQRLDTEIGEMQANLDAAMDIIEQGPRSITVSHSDPTAPDAEGRPDGALWEVRTEPDEHGQAVTLRRWYLIGGAWVQTEVMGNLIVNDTIDATKLRADELFAQTIAGNIATFQEAFIGKLSAQSIISDTFQGYRVEGAEIVSPGASGNITIADNTMVVQRNLPDDDGTQVTMRLGGSESDQFSLTPAGSSEATVFMDGASGDANFAGNVSMNDLRVGGMTLSEMLDPRPRGIIGMTWGSGVSLPDVGSNSYGLVRFTWAIESGRKYLFGADLKVQGTPGDKIQFTLHHSAAAGPADVSSAVLSIWYYEIPIGGVGSFHLERPIQMPYSHPDYNVLLSMRNWSTSTRPVRLWSDAGSAQSQSYFWIEDKGRATTEASSEWVTGVGKTFGDTVAPPAPAPTKRTYTKTYQASGAWSWRSGSLVWDSLQHGEESRAYRQSQILFPPSVVTDLDGATLLKARLKMRNTHTWYGAGMTALISTGSQSSQQSSPPTSATNQSVKWGRGETKYVTLNNFVKGQRSVWLGIGAPGGNEHFGRFSRTLSDLVLELTYEK